MRRIAVIQRLPLRRWLASSATNHSRHGLNILSMRVLRLSVATPNTATATNVSQSPPQSSTALTPLASPLPVLSGAVLESPRMFDAWLDSIDRSQTFLINTKHVSQLCQILNYRTQSSPSMLTPDQSNGAGALTRNRDGDGSGLAIINGINTAKQVSLSEALTPYHQHQRHSYQSTSLTKPRKPAPLADKERHLFDLVINGDNQMLSDFIALNPDVDLNVRHPQHGGSPLHVAALYNHCNSLVTLVEHGANVNARALNDSTPLHWAAGNGHTEAVRTLLEHGADASLMTSTWFTSVNGRGSGQSASHWASESGHTDVIEVLNHYSPSTLASIDERGRSVKDLAEHEGKFDTLEKLQILEHEKFLSLTIELVGRSNVAQSTRSK